MKVFVAGHSGMVGGAIARLLEERGDHVVTQTYAQLDLTNQLAVRQYMRAEKPDVVIMAAGRTGGITDKTAHPSIFLYENMMMAANVIHQAHGAGVPKLLYIGSADVYPKSTVQPVREALLLTGRPDTANMPIAIAKIAGMALCDTYRREHGRDYRVISPTSVYGPGDDFDPETAHVIPGLIRRCHEAVLTGADRLAVWGTGKPLRDFLYIDDLAAAVLFVLDLPEKTYTEAVDPVLGHLNVGSGGDISIRDLSKAVARVAGFSGRLILDTTKPDGASRRLLDTRRLEALGWRTTVPLDVGLKRTYDWFLHNLVEG